MGNPSGLGSSKIIAFVPTRNAERAKEFYGTKVGLRFVSEDAFATVFDANGTMLRVANVQELTPARFTILGWEVADIGIAVDALSQAGVQCEQFGLPNQDAAGIWTAPGGARVAWFKDPDGNVLSISQHVDEAG